ncbi:MAG: tRNA 4-thiouridine(8) synthase ThiI [Thomasclavelia sp.]|nr:tRNA 4-thiouridine(8) synthase ThiI [Thomasclavelia sp.]
MKADYVLVRFGELTTKGKNRKLFTRRLLDNLKEVLADYPQIEYRLTHDRLYMHLNDANQEDVCEKIKLVFGIYSFSCCYKLDTDINEVKKVASYLVNTAKKTTFKIMTKRSDKTYPATSLEISKDVAGYVLTHTDHELKVDVRNPEVLITVEIRNDAYYVMDNTIKGAGGYPVGVGGKALLMLSGGIDSPVAGYLTMKRGVNIECIHFAAPPYTNEQARQKVFDLVDKIRKYGHGKIKVHVVNFTELQLAVYKYTDEPYAMTVMRRMMYRIAERVANENKCLAIVNGESIGQVASQTLNSMNTINSVITMPVIRPVVCLDKLEIIDIANQIDTYDISIKPFEDCCTIFTPKNPATKPTAHKAAMYEEKFDYQPLIDECVNTVETITINDNYNKNEDIF